MIRLPYPPSINHYYANNGKGGRYIKPDGVAYRLAVANAAREIKYGDSLIAMTVYLHQKDMRKRDLDNGLKCLLDSLMHAGVFDDDSQIVELIVRKGNSNGVWVDELKEGYCEVKIERLSDL
jgi:crossover junction endodeoxyribonuclease RusA